MIAGKEGSQYINNLTNPQSGSMFTTWKFARCIGRNVIFGRFRI